MSRSGALYRGILSSTLQPTCKGANAAGRRNSHSAPGRNLKLSSLRGLRNARSDPKRLGSDQDRSRMRGIAVETRPRHFLVSAG